MNALEERFEMIKAGGGIDLRAFAHEGGYRPEADCRRAFNADSAQHLFPSNAGIYERTSPP